MNNLIAEVAVVSAQEKAMLDECEALLNFATAMQVRVVIYVLRIMHNRSLDFLCYERALVNLYGTKI